MEKSVVGGGNAGWCMCVGGLFLEFFFFRTAVSSSSFEGPAQEHFKKISFCRRQGRWRLNSRIEGEIWEGLDRASKTVFRKERTQRPKKKGQRRRRRRRRWRKGKKMEKTKIAAAAAQPPSPSPTKGSREGGCLGFVSIEPGREKEEGEPLSQAQERYQNLCGFFSLSVFFGISYSLYFLNKFFAFFVWFEHVGFLCII